MFNLLVQYKPWGDGHDTLPTARIFEYTDDDLVAKFKPTGQLDLNSLATLPTLFMQETAGQQDRVARVGTITRARLTSGDVVLDYTYDLTIPPIPNATLQTFAREHDIEDYQFSRTHWSVKGQDLYRFLLRKAQLRRPRPKVFQLAEVENIERKLVSAMMPFHPKFDAVYSTLQQAAKTAGLACLRADDIWKSPTVIQDVVSLIDRSNVVICDCTGRNPNVFYEIGIAHALGREVILLTQTDEDVPFDLRHLRFVRYLNNGEGLAALSANLQTRLSELCA